MANGLQTAYMNAYSLGCFRQWLGANETQANSCDNGYP